MIHLNLGCIALLLVVLSIGISHQKSPEARVFRGEGCELDHLFQTRYKRQIVKSIAPDVRRIIDYVISPKESGATYEALATFVDKFGSRLTGTMNLENSIDYMLDWLKREGHDNVHGENVTVPKWSRGKEWASMVKPRYKKLSILGLGYAEGTNGQVLEAPIVVVKDKAELDQRKGEIAGKIVVFNHPFEGYDTTYRSHGASWAASYGAVAVLIRSVASFSINSPHTGMMTYNLTLTTRKIPAISITVEDAELFQRLTDRKEEVVVRIYSENHLDTNTGTSRNTVSELTGFKYPNQVVLVSGHLDSWDVGQGAMDDGAGAFISWRALSVLKQMGFKTKRTLRSVLWTGEEFGYVGASQYVEKHQPELADLSIAMESDIGTFSPRGITYSGVNLTAQCIVHEIMKLMAPLNATELLLMEEGSDTECFYDKGVPITSLRTNNERYFYFHHSEGDTMTVESSDELDRCQALWTSVAYALAVLEDPLPR